MNGGKERSQAGCLMTCESKATHSSGTSVANSSSAACFAGLRISAARTHWISSSVKGRAWVRGNIAYMRWALRGEGGEARRGERERSNREGIGKGERGRFAAKGRHGGLRILKEQERKEHHTHCTKAGLLHCHGRLHVDVQDAEGVALPAGAPRVARTTPKQQRRAATRQISKRRKVTASTVVWSYTIHHWMSVQPRMQMHLHAQGRFKQCLGSYMFHCIFVTCACISMATSRQERPPCDRGWAARLCLLPRAACRVSAPGTTTCARGGVRTSQMRAAAKHRSGAPDMVRDRWCESAAMPRVFRAGCRRGCGSGPSRNNGGRRTCEISVVTILACCAISS